MDIGHDDGDDHSYESGLGKTDQWVSLTGGHDEVNHHYSYSYEYMMGWTGQTLGSSNKKRSYHNDDDGGDFEMHCHMMIIIPI